MSAQWHVRAEDRVRLSAELAGLDLRLHELDARIRDAINRQRYGRTPEEAAAGADDLRRFLREQDRLMTRTRAVEAKLLLLQKLSDALTGPSAAPESRPSEPSDRVAVEVDRDRHGTRSVRH
ncbi:MAG TPA: hypothetical protein VHG30_13510 [Microvirga sp.]|nr:hypothetical protein [Microvirga sp.]